ncbi:hypothetical protein GCM10010954_15040 [Halobacillus andaensis]|uniref:Uncharacterized protein n=1 Tax=Halobacillus andaensis TaxID=1176239 RepID=A0A917B1L9_HALAA|nr:hypothetical protein GCM10010954_15040 [Halobacillus andaensis]
MGITFYTTNPWQEQRRKRTGRHETHKQNGRRKPAFPSAGWIAYDVSVWALKLDVALLKKIPTVWNFIISYNNKKYFCQF